MTRFHLITTMIGLGLTFPLTSAAMGRQAGHPLAQDDGDGTGVKQRTVRDMSSHEIPVAITSVNKLNSDDWIKDMEFEVENRSNQPIYYVLLVIKFPDIPKTTEVDGIPRGHVTIVRYGRREFSSNPGELAREEDVPIKPGARAVMKLEPDKYLGLKEYLRQHDLPESGVKRLQVRIEDISFGDGSGYRSGSIPFYHRARS